MGHQEEGLGAILRAILGTHAFVSGGEHYEANTLDFLFYFTVSIIANSSKAL